jgi:hypothetical protein
MTASGVTPDIVLVDFLVLTMFFEPAIFSLAEKAYVKKEEKGLSQKSKLKSQSHNVKVKTIVVIPWKARLPGEGAGSMFESKQSILDSIMDSRSEAGMTRLQNEQ